VVVEIENSGVDTVLASVNYTLSEHVENLTLTGSSAILGIGNTLNNLIVGNSADNTLDGREGNDTLQGGGGNDRYIVDSTGDVIIEAVNAGIDSVYSSIDYTLGANLENLDLTGTTAMRGIGNELDNKLYGNSANNLLEGGAGNDFLEGDSGKTPSEAARVMIRSMVVLVQICSRGARAMTP
jgi:trimeric autotransporter adhesin